MAHSDKDDKTGAADAATGDSANGEEKPAKTSPDMEALQADIVNTRHELAHTVEALSAKLDVKAQAKAKVDETRATVQARAQAVWSEQRPALIAGVGGAVAVVVLLRRRAARRAAAQTAARTVASRAGGQLKSARKAAAKQAAMARKAAAQQAAAAKKTATQQAAAAKKAAAEQAAAAKKAARR